MAWLNKIMVIGNVGTDPEMRFTPNGKPVTSFPLATNRFFTTSDGERKRETESNIESIIDSTEIPLLIE